MTDHVLQTVDMLVSDVTTKQKEIAELQRTINYLCTKAGIATKYEQIETPGAAGNSASLTIAPDEYHGKPLNRAVTDYMNRRAKSMPNAKTASAEEIYDVLIRGGYTFEQRSKDEQMHSLKTSLGKSTHTFRKLPNGTYGLVEWYGENEPKQRRPRKVGNGSTDAVTGGTDAADTDDANTDNGADTDAAPAPQLTN